MKGSESVFKRVDDTYAIIHTYRKLIIYNIETRQKHTPIRFKEDPISQVAFSPEDKLIYTLDSKDKIWVYYLAEDMNSVTHKVPFPFLMYEADKITLIQPNKLIVAFRAPDRDDGNALTEKLVKGFIFKKGLN